MESRHHSAHGADHDFSDRNHSDGGMTGGFGIAFGPTPTADRMTGMLADTSSFRVIRLAHLGDGLTEVVGGAGGAVGPAAKAAVRPGASLKRRGVGRPRMPAGRLESMVAARLRRAATSTKRPRRARAQRGPLRSGNGPALPNDDPASHRFLITPVPATIVQSGIVQPSFGKPGGGVEVIFTNGSQRGTVTLPPHKLPDR